MYIKSIHFKNFGRHEELKVDLQCGLIGIVGPNGCGKSTITDGVYAALTNDFGRFDGKKEENITDTSDPQENSFIELVVVHNNQELKILRSLRPNKSRLWISGRDEPFTKSGDIQREIEERLGITNKLLDKFCFVGQWGMFSFLSDTPGDRAKVYQQLCGTEHAQSVCDAITSLLQQDDLNVVVEDNRDELRQQIANTEKADKEALAKADEMRSKLLSDDKLTKAEGIVAKRARYDDAVKTQGPMQTRIDVLVEDVANSKQLVDKAKSQLADANKELEVIEAQCDKAQETAASCKSYRENHARYAEAGRHLSTLKFEFTTLEENTIERGWHVQRVDTPQLAELKAANVRLEDLVTKYDDQVEALNSNDVVVREVELRYQIDGVYGVDGQLSTRDSAVSKVGKILDEMPDHLGDPKAVEELELKSAAATEELDSNLEKIDNIESHNQSVSRAKAELDRISDKIKDAEKYLLDYAEYAQEPDEEAELNAFDILNKRKQLRSNVGVMITDLANEEKRLSILQGNLESYQQQLDDLKTRIEANFVSDDLRDRANRAIARHRAAVPEVASAEADARSHRQYREKLTKELEALEARLDRTGKARRFAARMKKIRDEVLHRQALPQAVAQTNLEDMESDINEVLDMFGSPFWVETSEDLSFVVHFPGEPPKAANRLSGGQKGVLAVAFRVAINALFKSEIGMMTLDEPTAGMDDTNVGYLADALQRFAAQVRGNRQIIMITHADQLRPSFDQVVDFGDNDLGVSNHESNEVHLAVNS